MNFADFFKGSRTGPGKYTHISLEGSREFVILITEILEPESCF